MCQASNLYRLPRDVGSDVREGTTGPVASRLPVVVPLHGAGAVGGWDGLGFVLERLLTLAAFARPVIERRTRLLPDVLVSEIYLRCLALLWRGSWDIEPGPYETHSKGVDS